ncbi:MAG: EF-hand domain-containing protein, partial [Candidatus Poseidoniaceae archaeon]
EWDYDNDGEFDESHGFDYADCSLESNGSWKCFVGYADEEGEEGISVYYCTPFVAQNSAGFSIFNNTNLDDSLCGMEATDEMYEFDNSTFTMPINLIWEDCWTEGNETVCEQGEIYYDVNTTMLWETTHENNYMDCDGDYDNNTSMCTEWIGNITDADGSAFLLVSDWGESLIMYQYDEATQSGLVISVESDDDDYDPEMWFNMFDANEDGEVNASEWADFGNQSGEGMTEDDWDEILMLIEMFDEDNSSGLNLDEFTNMTESFGGDDEGDGDMDPEMMFNMLDGNGDGQVTASEWSDFSNSSDEPMSQEEFDFLSGMMDNYDDDDSGGLDFDEFMTFMDEMEDMEDGDEGDVKMYMVFGVLPYDGDLDDYHVELAMCDGTSLADIACTDSVYSVALSEIMAPSEEAAMMAMMTESIVFVDSDESGTLTSGDFVMINNDTLEVDDEWNFARLYSAEADSYSDENPMMSMLPGFTGFIATIGLLGAALIRRE